MPIIRTNAKSVADALRRFGRNLPRETGRACDIWARRTATEIKRGAPTGQTRNLRRSIMGRGGLHSGKAFALILASMRYAPFLEFGTDRHWVGPVRRKALRWIARGKGKRGYAFSRGHYVNGIDAREFFFPTITRHMDRLTAEIWKACSRHLRVKA